MRNSLRSPTPQAKLQRSSSGIMPIPTTPTPVATRTEGLAPDGTAADGWRYNPADHYLHHHQSPPGTSPVPTNNRTASAQGDEYRALRSQANVPAAGRPAENRYSNGSTLVGARGEDVEKEKDMGLGDDEKRPEYERTGSGWRRRSVNADKEDPFGDEEGAEIKYRTMAWWQAAMIMIAETVSLGILSLPSVLATIGLVPGVILIAGLGILATYTGYVLGQFKMRHPHVHNMADAGEILMGAVGREIFGAAQTIFLIFSMGSHVLTFTIALNAITLHATCTIVWGIIALVVLWLFTIPRTLKKVSWFSVVSFISILGSVLITMIALGIAPDGPNNTRPPIQSTLSVPFASAFLSVTNIIFAYAGHVAFFSFISEMKNPRDFPKTLFVLQITDTVLYIVVAVVVYIYAGADVSSPALGSTGATVKRIAYGVALPTIIIAGVIYGHVASKYIYVRLFRGTKHMSQKTFLSIGTWLLITLILWVIAFIIAESIPNFNDLLALISSIFASWFTYGLSGVFWLHMNWGVLMGREGKRTGKKWALMVLNVLLVIIGAVIMGAGLYASGTAIASSSGSGSWSCADNSQGD